MLEKKTVCRFKKRIQDSFVSMTRKPSVVYVFASVHDLSSEILGIIYKFFFAELPRINFTFEKTIYTFRWSNFIVIHTFWMYCVQYMMIHFHNICCYNTFWFSDHSKILWYVSWIIAYSRIQLSRTPSSLHIDVFW